MLGQKHTMKMPMVNVEPHGGLLDVSRNKLERNQDVGVNFRGRNYLIKGHGFFR
ncbi:hypothetical protein EDC27_1244 [Desulfosoma caldarium]|uniref:Uncharacterized protein n=1 Tax=Desulfosoma caldarium TaxID=610254 RepID=A0A3N1V115_9BACT|nr:hypothetical protein EDC27_1244 [Desulfosoma caldarium]